MADLNVKIKSLHLKNPVMTASGTFGYGEEFDDFMDVSQLGAIIVKGTTIKHREGNAYPRMAETPSGMLNAVGLQNKGVEYFTDTIYPRIKKYDTNIIVNVSGSTLEDYIAVVEKLNDLEKIPAIELNISCPNVKQGGMAFGTSCESAAWRGLGSNRRRPCRHTRRRRLRSNRRPVRRPISPSTRPASD